MLTRYRRRLGMVLMVGGGLLLTAVALVYVAPVFGQWGVHPIAADSGAAAAKAAARPSVSSSPRADMSILDWPPGSVEAGSTVGQLDIPSIGLSARVVELQSAQDLRALLGAPGHLPGTALPGHANASVIAAHNNTFFHHLDSLKTGDRVLFTLPSGRLLTYLVTSARVIGTSDNLLIHPTPSQLLLVTCYPLDDLFLTPNRYVVSAQLVGEPLAPATIN